MLKVAEELEFDCMKSTYMISQKTYETVKIDNISNYTPTYSGEVTTANPKRVENILALCYNWDHGNLSGYKNYFVD
jgi:hypothetical protein